MLGSWQGVNGRKKVENPWIRRWRIRQTEIYTKDRNFAGTDEKVTIERTDELNDDELDKFYCTIFCKIAKMVGEVWKWYIYILQYGANTCQLWLSIQIWSSSN